MLLWLAGCVPAPDEAAPLVITPFEEEEGEDSASPTDDTAVDSGADSAVLPPLVEAPTLLINEVMSANTCSVGLDGTTPDYLELYNASAETVTLDRVAVWDGDGVIWVGDPAVEIAPAGWFLLYADGRTDKTDHAPFTLSAGGDTLTVAVDGQVTDRIALGLLPDDLAWARFPDGGEWDLTGYATPAASNGLGPADFVDPFLGGYTIDRLHEVNVTLDAAAISALGRSPQTYTEGGVSFDEIGVEPVGIRIRGSSTFQPIDQKPSLKIDLNRYAEGTYCGDLNKVNLLNMIYDYGFIKQWSAYHVMRQMGVVSARNGFARVSINEEYRGVYLYSEAYDDIALNTFYGYDDVEGWMIWEESGLECETDTCDDAIVQGMLRVASGPPSEAALQDLESRLDVDEALAEIAGELIVQQWDGYCAPHNFRYAWNPVTGLLAILPSSVDLTFDSPTRSVNLYSCPGSPLLDFCLGIERCASRYDEILLEYADGIEGWMDLDAQFDQIYALVAPTYADERYGYVRGEAEQIASFEQIRAYFHEMPAVIRAQVASH